MTENVAVPQPAPAEAPTIPKELENQMNGLRALVQCHELLEQAMFPHSKAASVGQCLGFLQALHAHALGEARKHPSAHLVPALLEESPHAPQAK